MATLAELETALVNADKAGDTAAATRLAAEILRVRSASAGPDQNDPLVQSARESATPGALSRVGRGFVDVGQGVKQFIKKVSGAEDADAYSREIAEEHELYEGGRKAGAPKKLSDLVTGRDADPGFDWWRLGGNVAATAPLGAFRFAANAPSFLRYGAITGQGAAAGAAQPVLEDQGDFAAQKAIQTSVGAAVAPVAGAVVEKGAQFITNRVVRPVKGFIESSLARARGAADENAVLRPDGTLTEKGIAALKNLGLAVDDLTDDVRARLQTLAEDATKTKAMTPEQQIRAAMFREVTGEEATLGQVTRDFAQQQTEGELKKLNSIGGPLRARLAKQNRGLLDAVEGVRAGTGAAAPDEYAAGQAVSTSVRAADKEAREAVSMLYRQIGEEKGAQFKIKPQGLLDRLDEVSDNAEADQIVASVTRKLKRFGLMNDNGQLRRGASLNAGQAEELRKFVGGLSSDSPSKKRMLSMLVDSLDDDVKAAAGEDVYEIARQVARTRFEDLRIPAVRAIVDGDVAPEQIFDKFVRRGSIDDLKALKGYMSRETDVAIPASGGKDVVKRDPHNLGAAWNEVRGQALVHMLDQATRQSARNELDDVLFSGAMFRKALKDVGDEKLGVLFTPEEIAKLEKVAKVAEWRIPIADALNTSNTSSAMWNMVDRILSYLPGRAGMVARGAGRAARIGAEEIEAETAAKAAMVPAETLAKRAEEEARKKAAEGVREGVGLLRGPSFFSLGAERKRSP